MTEGPVRYGTERPLALLPNTATHERWIGEAIRFMTETHGRPLDMEDEQKAEAWHARLGLLAHFISWVRQESAHGICPGCQASGGDAHHAQCPYR